MRRFIIALKSSIPAAYSSASAAASSVGIASTGDAPSAVKAAPLMSSMFVKEWRKSLDAEARIMKNVPALKVDQSVGRYVCSPFAFAAFSQIQSGRGLFAPPRAPAAVGASSPFAFAAFSQIQSGRGLFAPPRAPAAVGASSPFAFAAFSTIGGTGRGLFSPPRALAAVGESFAAFFPIGVQGSGRGLLAPPRVTAAVGARCYSEETIPNYNHIEQQRIYREKKRKEPILRKLAKVNGRLKAGQSVQIFLDGEKVSLLDVDLPPKGDIMGRIYLAGGLVFRASQVVMES